jgi:GNAT superfamily N-acetyltransferase
MRIRQARESDYPHWVPLWQGYQAFYKTEISEDTTLKTWARFLDPQEPMHCALAEVETQTVGMVHFIFHRSCWTTGDYCYLQDLFVHPEFRGQGIATTLIQHVYAKAEDHNASRVWWLTHESNHEAMQLYNKIASKSGFLQYRKLLGSG